MLLKSVNSAPMNALEDTLLLVFDGGLKESEAFDQLSSPERNNREFRTSGSTVRQCKRFFSVKLS